MKTAPSNWSMKVKHRMNETGESWWEACSFFGKRGGLVSGLNRSRRSKALSQERRRQEAIGIR